MCLCERWGVEHSRRGLACRDSAASPLSGSEVSKRRESKLAQDAVPEVAGGRDYRFHPHGHRKQVGRQLGFAWLDLFNFHVKSLRQIGIKNNTINPCVSTTRLKK